MIEQNYRRVQNCMADACARARRDVSEITLIAVTKYVPIERIAEAITLGVRHVGENRVQELLKKIEFFENNRCIVHCIGQLQTNKVKYIIGKTNVIQSVDRITLLQEIAKAAKKNADVQDILVQVNIGEESQKGGILKDKLFEFLSMAGDLEGVRVRGLMCIPPALDAENTRPYFREMRELYERAKTLYATVDTLSMGMSADYVAAIEEGANMIRVGTALFGARNYH